MDAASVRDVRSQDLVCIVLRYIRRTFQPEGPTAIVRISIVEHRSYARGAVPAGGEQGGYGNRLPSEGARRGELDLSNINGGGFTAGRTRIQIGLRRQDIEAAVIKTDIVAVSLCGDIGQGLQSTRDTRQAMTSDLGYKISAAILYPDDYPEHQVLA